jgi:hypothetical protein
MPQVGGPSCISLSSENVKTCATQAWTEVRPVAESLPKPNLSTLARFFPTDACATPINAALSELKVRIFVECTYFLSDRISKQQAKISNYKIGGFVFFPGISQVGQTFTIMIPLCIEGETSIDELVLGMDHYYYITRKCDINVSKDARLVALVIDLELLRS